jgi:hypothetical protein
LLTFSRQSTSVFLDFLAVGIVAAREAQNNRRGRSFPTGKARFLGSTPTETAGEHIANVLRWPSVALRTCRISFTGPSGIRHSVDVTAESVYEAAALGVSALKKSGWVEVVALGTEIEVQVSEPATSHRITVQQIHRWCDGIAISPEETLRKRRLKQLLS